MSQVEVKPKRRIRRSKGTGPRPKLYFNSDTQAAIVKYQTLETPQERNIVYMKEIQPAFEKLAENLINIHKFTSLHDTFDDLKNDCVNFLFETIRKFDATRGTNAFSYFNVVAKNWLIIKTKQRTARTKKNVSLDDQSGLSLTEHKTIEDYNTVPSQEDILNNAHMSEFIIQTLLEIRSKVKSESELLCINSIITIFENIEEIDLLNKSALMLYIRELSGLSPKQLTTSIQSIKRHYEKLKLDNKLLF